MKIDNSLILCDERINGIKEEIAQYKNMEQAAKDAQSKLNQLLIGHYIEKVKEDLLSGLEYGDKVKVTTDVWGGYWGGCYSQGKTNTEEGFLSTVFVDKYFSSWPSTDAVRIKFAKPKKDGTPSLRYSEYSVSQILKIEKV